MNVFYFYFILFFLIGVSPSSIKDAALHILIFQSCGALLTI